MNEKMNVYNNPFLLSIPSLDEDSLVAVGIVEILTVPSIVKQPDKYT